MWHCRRREGLPASRLVGPNLPAAIHGASLDALRPAWASWMVTAMGEWLRTASSTRPSAASLASLYRPRSAGVMRPSGETAVASMISRPAPDSAIWPR
jgi:hypothetical protein